MAKHYPSPWVDGKPSDAIVAKYPYPPEGYGNTELVEDYGGYLIAETVALCNKPLIKAAPEMYVALELGDSVGNEGPFLLEYAANLIGHFAPHTAEELRRKAKAERTALAKARGESEAQDG